MDIDYRQLAQAMLAEMGGVKTKTVSSTPATGVYGHGNGGLFSSPGLDNQLFSAMILPDQGLQSLLPVYPNWDTDPLYGIVTGVTAPSGSEPTGVCDDPPVAGLMKLCSQTARFGRVARMTPVIEIDRVGERTNRGEFLDFTVNGSPNLDNPTIPTLPGTGDITAAARNEVAKKMFELAVVWSRDTSQELYTGNPANNTAGGGRKYFYGLDILINTGYRDAETGTACAAADSIVRNWQNQLLSNTASALVKEIAMICHQLTLLADRTNLSPVQWVLAMRGDLFYELSAVWACAYYTTHCSSIFSTSQVQSSDATEITRLRDDMRQRKYLLIDGVEWPVVLDNAIAETGGLAPKGTYSSGIYFVPLVVLGGRRVTYMEYKKYDQAGASMEAARAFAPADSYFTSDDGRFLWHKRPPEHYCVQLEAKTEPRLLLRTPFLAARLTNIAYTPLLHERDPFTSSSYFVDGGKTNRLGYGPSYYSPTS